MANRIPSDHVLLKEKHHASLTTTCMVMGQTGIRLWELWELLELLYSCEVPNCCNHVTILYIRVQVSNAFLIRGTKKYLFIYSQMSLNQEISRRAVGGRGSYWYNTDYWHASSFFIRTWIDSGSENYSHLYIWRF